MPESAERVTVRTVRDDPSPGELKAYVAALFAAIDGRPRRMFVEFDLRNRRGTAFSIDLAGGEPVFRTDDGREAKASFRGRWLAEHPVPLRMSGTRVTALVMEPAGGNRVRVRKPTFAERIFGPRKRREQT